MYRSSFFVVKEVVPVAGEVEGGKGVRSEEVKSVTRSIMIVKPPGYVSPPVSPASSGTTPPVSPFSGEMIIQYMLSYLCNIFYIGALVS